MRYPGRLIRKGELNTTIVSAVRAQLTQRGITDVAATGPFDSVLESAVKLFQSLFRDQHNRPLEIDGIIGPISWEVLFNEPGHVFADAPDVLLREALTVARSQIGKMEQPVGSNRGPDVEKYLASVGLGGGLFWCAAFVHWCFQTAAGNLNVRNPLVKTGGVLDHWARTRAKKILAANAQNDPTLVRPGHIFIISHGGGRGHTGIVARVEGGHLVTVEGNSNPNGSSNGIGVFELNLRSMWKINKGFLDYSS